MVERFRPVYGSGYSCWVFPTAYCHGMAWYCWAGRQWYGLCFTDHHLNSQHSARAFAGAVNRDADMTQFAEVARYQFSSEVLSGFIE